jgi:hypothetical protein
VRQDSKSLPQRQGFQSHLAAIAQETAHQKSVRLDDEHTRRLRGGTQVRETLAQICLKVGPWRST